MCGKIFEKTICSPVYKFFHIYQPLSITHKTNKTFGKGVGMRDIFLDISRAFDKVWHRSTSVTMRQNVVWNSFLQLVTYYFENIGNKKLYYMVEIFLEQIKFYLTLPLFTIGTQLFSVAHYKITSADKSNSKWKKLVNFFFVQDLFSSRSGQGNKRNN